jgi:hypothetical protein
MNRFAARSFDNLVGGHEYGRWYRQSQRFGGLEVDHSFELVRRLHRKVGWVGAAQYAVYIPRGLTILIDEIGGIRHEPAGRHKKPECVDRRARAGGLRAR